MFVDETENEANCSVALETCVHDLPKAAMVGVD